MFGRNIGSTMQRGTLAVEIIEATNLPFPGPGNLKKVQGKSRSRDTLSRPFVSIEVKGKQFMTAVKAVMNSPVFNETLEFRNIELDKSDVVVFRLLNSTADGNGLYGEFSLTFGEILSSEMLDKVMKNDMLKGKNKKIPVLTYKLNWVETAEHEKEKKKAKEQNVDAEVEKHKDKNFFELLGRSFSSRNSSTPRSSIDWSKEGKASEDSKSVGKNSPPNLFDMLLRRSSTRIESVVDSHEEEENENYPNQDDSVTQTSQEESNDDFIDASQHEGVEPISGEISVEHEGVESMSDEKMIFNFEPVSEEESETDQAASDMKHDSRSINEEDSGTYQPINEENETYQPINEENETYQPINEENETYQPISKENETYQPISKENETYQPINEENEDKPTVSKKDIVQEDMTQSIVFQLREPLDQIPKPEPEMELGEERDLIERNVMKLVGARPPVLRVESYYSAAKMVYGTVTGLPIIHAASNIFENVLEGFLSKTPLKPQICGPEQGVEHQSQRTVDNVDKQIEAILSNFDAYLDNKKDEALKGICDMKMHIKGLKTEEKSIIDVAFEGVSYGISGVLGFVGNYLGKN